MAKYAVTLLNHPVIQFLVTLIAVGNLVLFIYANNYLCVGVFILSAILAFSFSKNMVVILVVAMVLCNIICVGTSEIESFRKRGKGMKGRGGKGGCKLSPEVLSNIKSITQDIHTISLSAKPLTPMP